VKRGSPSRRVALAVLGTRSRPHVPAGANSSSSETAPNANQNAIPVPNDSATLCPPRPGNKSQHKGTPSIRGHPLLLITD